MGAEQSGTLCSRHRRKTFFLEMNKCLKARSSELRTRVMALLTLVAARTCFFTRPVSKAVALMTCGKARRFRSTKVKAQKAPVLKTSRQPDLCFLKTSFSSLEILLLWVTKEAKTRLKRNRRKKRCLVLRISES